MTIFTVFIKILFVQFAQPIDFRGGDEFLAERDKAICERNEYRDKYDRSERENSKLREKISYFQDLLQLLETMFPSIFEKIKTMLQARYDKEYEQEQQRIADRKKRNRDISR